MCGPFACLLVILVFIANPPFRCTRKIYDLIRFSCALMSTFRRGNAILWKIGIKVEFYALRHHQLYCSATPCVTRQSQQWCASEISWLFTKFAGFSVFTFVLHRFSAPDRSLHFSWRFTTLSLIFLLLSSSTCSSSRSSLTWFCFPVINLFCK